MRIKLAQHSGVVRVLFILILDEATFVSPKGGDEGT